jgi:hypothetical protein
VAGVLLLIALKLAADLLQIAGFKRRTQSRRQVLVAHRGPRA